MVNEFSYLSTGYSTYGREVLSRLHEWGYHVAEFASYVHHNDPRVKRIPWAVYCNLPDTNNEQEVNRYRSKDTNVFGEWRFEEVCINYKPDIVFDIRDWWMLEFESRSPFRRFYNWCIMPTVDAYPQNKQWMDTYLRADNVLTYTNWSGDVLKQQSGNKVKWAGHASPSAAECYKALNLQTRKILKQKLGINPDTKVIGTVMRNQRRKLYPELFEVFRNYLDKTKDDNIVLYCHSSYPDKNGWDFPTLIKDYGLSRHLLFTYLCGSCGYSAPQVFQDAITHCVRCGQKNFSMSSVQKGLHPEVLAEIYNTFDIYVQFANSEGFGMPQLEAAACGVPVASTDYSAMSEVVRNVDGYPIEVESLYTEIETGCKRAHPSKKHLLDILVDFFNMPEQMREVKRNKTRSLYEQNYSWDKTARRWADVFDTIEPLPSEETWLSKPNIITPAAYNESEAMRMSNDEYCKWLILNVLRDPSKIDSFFHTRMLRDFSYGAFVQGMAGGYYNDSSALFVENRYEPFTKEKAYEIVAGMVKYNNHWEMIRAKSI